MSLVTITQSAKLAGKSTQTLYRHIKSGKLSRRNDKLIDTAELIRVYGDLSHDDITSDATHVTPVSLRESVNVAPDTSQTEHVKWLESQIVQLQTDMQALKSEGLVREQQSIEREQRLMALLEHRQDDKPDSGVGLFGRLFK